MKSERAWTGYLAAVLATLACTAIATLLHPRFDLANIAMIYMVAVVFVAIRCTRGAAILTATLCVAALDYLFVPPRGTFTVDDVQYLLTFAIMAGVALVISRLVADVRRKAREQAQLALVAETERVRSTLLASISHDLRTPLAVMAGASSSLAEAGERLGPHERQALAETLFRQSQDMAERVAKILDMTRLETGTLEVLRDWSSPAEIAASALARLRERMASHRVIVDVPASLPLIRVDAALIEQALGNLLENAAQHTPPGTVVSVSGKVAGRELVLSVEDYGGGIPAEDIERIFEKFHRGAMESGPSGIGLGLAICRAIVRLHGGRAWAERNPAGGTVFRIALPIDEAPPGPPAAAGEADG